MIRPATVTPRFWTRRCSRRVSSAATMSAVVSSSISRAEASPALPIGVAASTILPGTADLDCAAPVAGAVAGTGAGAVLDVVGRARGVAGKIGGGAGFGSTRPAYCGAGRGRRPAEGTAAKGSMGNVTQTPTRHARARRSSRPPESAPADQPLSTGRNLEGHRWVGRPAEAFTPEALKDRLIGGIQSWRDYPASLRLWFWLIPGPHRGAGRRPALRPAGHAAQPGLRRDLLRQGRRTRSWSAATNAAGRTGPTTPSSPAIPACC